MFLNCHTYYSLRYGILSPEELVKEAVVRGVERMALTDINNTTGMFDFVKACGNAGVLPVAGVEFRNGDEKLYIGLARNRDGFRELNELLTEHALNKEPLPYPAPALPNVWIVYPLEKVPQRPLREQERIGMRPAQLSKLLSSPHRHTPAKLVLLQPVSWVDPEGYQIHRNLRAIQHNQLLSRLQPRQHAPDDEHFPSPQALRKKFESWPRILENTCKILESCSFNFDFQSVKNKKTFTGSPYDDRLLLEKLSLDGLQYRYGKNHKEANRRVKHELDIIDRMDFAAYFLITWDIIRYSMSRGFYHVGRGSGANSVVAYCLKITDVDPIELDLYFERFINPKRSSPPDFDIDYSWKDRDEVQDYIFKRYGRRHTALLGTISTFRGKSIVRELGKVYGLPKEEIDALIENPSHQQNRNEISDHIFSLGNKIADFPNMRSIHAGGILISEEPITCYTALDMPPKGFQTTQFDMYVAEMIGFEKLDILSQRGIGHIQESAEIIRENRGVAVDVHAIQDFKQDPQVKKQLKSGETLGCFYIESPAMRGLLKKLNCDNYRTLVAASSIIRPGVARSGMMRQYIERFHNPNGFSYIHPVMQEQLQETYGVMVYQEDVLKICHHFAGLDLADADVLRRAMSGKYRSRLEFQRIVDKFFANCKEKGYPDEITKEVWRQIESFAGYSFSKAHSASYAVESFQSLYLKSHYPKEFMVAVINNFGGFYRSWVYVNEARRAGAQIELPCVNHSAFLTCIRGDRIYLGFVHMQNLEQKIARQIAPERQVRGPYADLADFIARLRPGLEQVVLLIRMGAFRFTGLPKTRLLWDAHMLLNKKKKESSYALFNPKRREFNMPDLPQSPLEHAYDEIELLGFPLTQSWFDLLKTSFRGEITANALEEHHKKTVRMVGHLVTIKYIKTVNKEWMHFGTFVDHQGNLFDTTHFPKAVKQYPFQGKGSYLILGKVVDDFGYKSLEVQKMAKLPVQPDPRY